MLVTRVARKPSGGTAAIRIGAVVPPIAGGVEVGRLGVHVGVGGGLGMAAILTVLAAHARWQPPRSSIWHLQCNNEHISKPAAHESLA